MISTFFSKLSLGLQKPMKIQKGGEQIVTFYVAYRKQLLFLKHCCTLIKVAYALEKNFFVNKAVLKLHLLSDTAHQLNVHSGNCMYPFFM